MNNTCLRDRQTDSQTAERHTDGQIVRQTGRQADRLTDRQRETDRHTETDRDIETETDQTDRQRHRDRDKDRDRGLVSS